MKIRIVVGSLALGAVILLWPLLWTGLNAGTLLRQEPDAAQLFRLTPKALLLGAAFTPVAEPQSIRVLTRTKGRNTFKEQLSRQGRRLRAREGSSSLWHIGPTVIWPAASTSPKPSVLRLSCRYFALNFNVCDGKYVVLTD